MKKMTEVFLTAALFACLTALGMEESPAKAPAIRALMQQGWINGKYERVQMQTPQMHSFNLFHCYLTPDGNWLGVCLWGGCGASRYWREFDLAAGDPVAAKVAGEVLALRRLNDADAQKVKTILEAKKREQISYV